MKSRQVLQRYAPFIAILAIQALLLWLTPGSSTTTVEGGTDQSTGQGVGGSGVEQPSGQDAAASTAAAGSSSGSSAGAAASSGGTAARTGVTAAGAKSQAATGNAAAASAAGGGAAGQAVDALGRPTSGDKAKCAAGGLLQESVTYTSPPCMPKFVGDNG